MSDGVNAENSALVDKVRGILAEQLGVDPGEMTTNSSITDDLGADSLDVVELVMALEETFDIEVPDDAAEEMGTIGDVEKYILGRLAS